MHNPTTKLPSSSKKGGLAKHLLSCHPQEVCLAAGKVRERREKEEREERKEKQNLKIKYFIYKSSKLTKFLPHCCFTKNSLFVTKQEGLI